MSQYIEYANFWKFSKLLNKNHHAPLNCTHSITYSLHHWWMVNTFQVVISNQLPTKSDAMSIKYGMRSLSRVFLYHRSACRNWKDIPNFERAARILCESERKKSSKMCTWSNLYTRYVPFPYNFTYQYLIWCKPL